MGHYPPYDLTPGPAFSQAARQSLEDGRARLAEGNWQTAMAAFREAVAQDCRSFLCPWGIIPRLKSEGRDRMPRRMQARVASWHSGAPPLAVETLAGLSYKPRMTRWAAAHGFATPTPIAKADRLEVLDFDSLPSRCVIKPANGAANAGVIVLRDGRNALADEPIGADLKTYALDLWARDGVANAAVLVEALIDDVDRPRDPALRVPRDVKVFCAGGSAAFFRVFDRNGPNMNRSRATYDRFGAWIDDPSPDWDPPADRRPPTGFEQAISEAERASRLFPWMVRFDFYCTATGPVLGEVTTTPNLGIGFRGIVWRTMHQMLEAFPDPE